MTMATSQNGWPALTADSSKLHTWVIPAKTGQFTIRTRNGSAGFLLAHFALWYAETIEPVKGDLLDDWGFAYRPVRGQAVGLSNHASGTAIDLNATQHGLGQVRTGVFAKKANVDRIHGRLAKVYKGAIRWGGDYHGRKDEMHWEIVQNITYCERLAKSRVMQSPLGRGRRILKANPGQREVIYS